MKKKFIIFCIVLLIIVFGLLFVFFFNKQDSPYLKEISYEEYIEKVNNSESFILYVKQTYCSHCKSFTPVISKVLEDYKIEANYINLTKLSDNERDIFTNELSINGTPSVLFFEEGIELGKYSRIVGDKTYKYIVNKLETQGYIEI